MVGDLLDFGPDQTPRLIKTSTNGAPIFHHPCEVCGNPNAPFGYGVSIIKHRPGNWRCTEHRKGGDDGLLQRD